MSTYFLGFHEKFGIDIGQSDTFLQLKDIANIGVSKAFS